MEMGRLAVRERLVQLRDNRRITLEAAAGVVTMLLGWAESEVGAQAAQGRLLLVKPIPEVVEAALYSINFRAQAVRA
jgi:hypothetical protein